MRIGLCGSAGTGKSTLAERIAKELDIPLINEQARTTAALLGIRRIEDLEGKIELGRIFQFACILNQIQTEDEAGSNFITDRTVFDNMMYWNMYHAENNSIYLSEAYFDIFYNHRKGYDLLVYVPIEFRIKSDGFRCADPECQKQEDEEIRKLLENYAESRFITVRGSIEERVEQILQEVRKIAN